MGGPGRREKQLDVWVSLQCHCDTSHLRCLSESQTRGAGVPQRQQAPLLSGFQSVGLIPVQGRGLQESWAQGS